MSEGVFFIICYIVYNLYCYLASKDWKEQVLKECKQMYEDR